MQGGNSPKVERHRRMRALFEAASAEPPEKRLAFLREQCGHDVDLEKDVARLLSAADGVREGSFLEKPAWNRAPAKAEVGDGSQFGAYKVIRTLKGGGMGSVYLTARSDDVFKRTAALKLIRPDCMTPDLLRRFHQERQILAELDHPNIARILDGGTTPEGLPYFVMEYVEGEHIDVYCTKLRLSLEHRLVLFEQVCRAVAYLHQNRIIHRDLKPSNILVAAGGTVKLLDFGIAKALDQPSDSTKTAPLMTIGYASPEQMLGEPVTPASDVYSLGVILYELLTGQRPYSVPDSQNLQQMISAVTTNEPALPSRVVASGTGPVVPETAAQFRRRLTGDLDTILLMALRRDPSRRYAGGAEFAADIHRHLHQLPVMARKESLVYRSSKFITRNRFGAIAAAAILALSGWGVRETYERQRLEERVRQLTASTRHELLAAERNQERFLQMPTGLGTSAEQLQMRDTELQDLRRVGESYRDSLGLAVRLMPGMTPERREMLARGEKYLSQARQLAGQDQQVLAEVAGGYLWLGDLRGYPGQANMNDRSGALQMYSEAESILQQAGSFSGSAELLSKLNAHVQAVRSGN